ncbi:MAG: rarD [Microbacteriaceae bacterium]|nr:rarD [Microbacteriaceae bacterium]
MLSAVLAYGLWGVLPAYFLLLQPSGAVEIVAWRILFSLVFCVLVVTVTRKWRPLIALLRQPRIVGTMGLAAAFIFVNWQVYIYATLSGQVIEAALGYFINPIVTVLLGVVFLRERLRALQWVAVGVSVIAVAVLGVNYGALPWVSLALALSFGFYGLIKKRVGGAVDALSGLTIETAWLVPVALIQLVLVAAGAGITFGTVSIGHTIALAFVGVATAVPLLLFAAAARRLPLVYLGLVQYLTPVIQFVFGAAVLGEAMTTVRWWGFGMVWIALVILSIDLILAARRGRRSDDAQGATSILPVVE